MLCKIFIEAFALVALLTTEYQLAAGAKDYEAELFHYLRHNITGYSPTLRPLLNSKQTVCVSADIIIGQIISVDSSKQSVTISAIISASWSNERLIWNPAKFGNITVMDWDSSQLWFPVVVVYNGLGDNQLLSPQLPTFITSVSPNRSTVSTGWIGQWEFFCKFNMNRFPFDRHSCEMELFANDQSRGLPSTVIKKGVISTDAPSEPTEYNNKGAYRTNGEWNLVNLTTYIKKIPYEVLKGASKVNLSTLALHMELERVSTYYILNVMTPLLLLTLLQVLVFFVPVESGEKLGFGITIMLSYTVFLLLLDGLLPKSQSMPAVASFITASMVLSTSSLLLTSVAIRFHFAAESQPMPSCLRFVFVSCLGRAMLCGVKRRGGSRTAPERDPDDAVVSKASDDGERRSDWKAASTAVERCMIVVGLPITAALLIALVAVPFAEF